MNIHGAVLNGDLDKNSYTAHRLHHGSPSHLHITSRRVFVGPIPVDWIKANRKDWYQGSLHGFYSKRSATFSPVQQTSGHRHVSNLAAPASEAPYESSSSWQDVTSESATPSEATTPAETPEVPESSTQTTRRNTSQSLTKRELERIKSAPEALLPPAQLKPRLAETWHAGSEPASISKAGPSHMFHQPSWITRGSRQDSFATAHETWSEDDEESFPQGYGGSRPLADVPEDSVASGELAEEPGEIRELPAELEEALREIDPVEDFRSSEAETADSRRVLLEGQTGQTVDGTNDYGPEAVPLDGEEVGISGSTRKSVSWGLGKRKKSTGLDSMFAPRTSTNLERVSGGLVRFNTAVNTRERDRKRQQKLSEMSRSRSGRRVGRRYQETRKREGEIIKMDSMLVRVEMAHSHTIPDDFDENGSRTVTTRLVDKWREYVVVCREGADEYTPMTLNLYKSRVIPAIDKPRVSTRTAKKIPLNAKTRVNIYSSLDKSLVVWLPHKYGTLIYIMRPRCSSTSVEWFTFLQVSLGEGRTKSLQIAVPDLSLSLLISNPFDELEKTLENNNENAIVEEERAVAANLVRQSMRMLDGVKEWSDITEYWKKSEKMGLAWRRYDRLEWIHGANEQRMCGSIAMQKTHELELRPKTHYPTKVRLPSLKEMEEPVPIEGFLIRLTSDRGRQERLGRLFQKRLYFTTHDNYLSFCRPTKALPPRPLNPKLCRNGSIPSADELAGELPLIYSVAPFPLDGHGVDIQWLQGTTPDVIEQKDKEAYEEAERKVNTLLNSEGFIDLCKVAEVRPRGQVDEAEESASNEVSDARSSQDRVFELVLDNGLIIALKSYNKETRDEWVMRLRDLVVYWKARDVADLAIVRRIRSENLKQLNVDEEMESELGQYARKWEVSRTMASPELYNVCGLSSCRAITLSGVLYRKPRRHATFNRYAVVLCHGHLMVFRYSQRDHSGNSVQTIQQDHILSISLQDCYIYSGLVTGSDLLYQNQTFDSNSPGRHALPRIFPDGYTSQDEDTMTCFVVWHGTRRSRFTRHDSDGKVVQQNLTQLGKTGKANVFKARSRLERDQWVMSISMEIERLNSGGVEEIKVQGVKEDVS